MEENLKKTNKSILWLSKRLEEQHISDPKEVFFAFVDNKSTLSVYKNG
ncbi:MAG: hypothetical protein ACI4RU_01630 [Acutalibacteraceae bacterium]